MAERASAERVLAGSDDEWPARGTFVLDVSRSAKSLSIDTKTADHRFDRIWRGPENASVSAASNLHKIAVGLRIPFELAGSACYTRSRQGSDAA
jgi:hypothetical protein